MSEEPQVQQPAQPATSEGERGSSKKLLKDELLLRENQVMGRDVFKNLYFTEFIRQ
jgi:hypothetical protein